MAEEVSSLLSMSPSVSVSPGMQGTKRSLWGWEGAFTVVAEDAGGHGRSPGGCSVGNAGMKGCFNSDSFYLQCKWAGSKGGS